jgi:hypothetical protein
MQDILDKEPNTDEVHENTKKKMSRYGQEDFFFPKRPDPVWGPPSLVFYGYWGSFSVRNWRDLQLATHLLSSNVVKSDWSFTLTPLLLLHGLMSYNYIWFTY